MEELYRRADEYSKLEDNICAATQTVMITNQLTEENKSFGKSRLSLRKVNERTKSDPVISHKKEGAAVIHPPKRLI